MSGEASNFFSTLSLFVLQKQICKRMSYGWLTQSAIMPKKSKEIKVKESGMMGMQTALLEMKQKLNNKKQPITGKKISHGIKRNSGIDDRIEKDEQIKAKFSDGGEKNSYKYLEKKAAIYENLNNKKANISKLLVDFQGREEQLTQKQMEQYEKNREQFYKGKLDQIADQQKSIHEVIEVEKSGLSQVRERLVWEKEVLQSMKKGTQECETKPKVIQAFDHKMTKQQKEALDKVLIQEQKQRQRLQEVRKRRQELEQDRIRKLRKLNIIKEEDERIEPLKKDDKST